LQKFCKIVFVGDVVVIAIGLCYDKCSRPILNNLEGICVKMISRKSL